MCNKGEIDVDDLSFNETAPCVVADLPGSHEGFSMNDYIEDIRVRFYERALEIAVNDQTKALALLGVTHQAVSKHRKILNRD